MTSQTTLSFGMIGYGQIAQLHARILRRLGHQIGWVAGPRAERAAAFAAQHAILRSGTDIAYLLTSEAADAVVVATPNDTHAEYTIASLDAGRHVLVEVPLALSFADGLAIARRADERGLIVTVGHNHRYLGGPRWLHGQVTAGALHIRSVTARYLLLRRENVGSNGYVRSWTDNLLWHHVLHSADVVLWLLQATEPGRVTVDGSFAPPDERGRTMDLSLALTTPDGRLGHVMGSYNSLINRYDYVVCAEEDTYVVEGGVLSNSAGIVLDFRQDQAQYADLARVALIEDFVAAVVTGRPSVTSARAVLPVLDAAQRAQDADEGRRRLSTRAG